MLAVVLVVQHELDPGEPALEQAVLGRALAAAAVGIAAPGEEGAGEVALVLPAALVDQRLQARAVGAGLGAEDAVAGAAARVLAAGARGDQLVLVRAHPGRDRVEPVRLVERGDRAHRLVEQLDLRREGVAEEARDAQGHVDPRPVEHVERQDLAAGDAAARRRPTAGARRSARAPARRRRRRCACWRCPRPRAPPRAASRPAPGRSARAAAGPSASRGARPRASAPRGCRPSRSCARSAARRRARGSARPTGPGSTKRPSSACSTAAVSAGPLASTAGRSCASIAASTAPAAGQSGGGARRPPTSARASSSRRSTVSPALRQGSLGLLARGPRGARPARARPVARRAGRSRRARGRPQARAAARRSPAVPAPRGTRASATSRSVSWSPAGAVPSTCRPSRICSSLSSQRWRRAWQAALSASSPTAMPRSRSRPTAPALREDLAAQPGGAARVDAGGLVVLVDQALELARAGRRSRRASAAASGGRRSPPAARRLAWLPSPGSLTMNG